MAGGVNAQVLQRLKDRFQPGNVFHMSKPMFADNVKQQYNSTPKSEVVSMVNTTFTPVLSSAGKPRMPEPAIPVAASMSIDTEQQFDALALIQNITEMAPGGQTAGGQRRVRCKITLIDGSKKEHTD